MTIIHKQIIIDEEWQGQRLDQALVMLLQQEFSRARVQLWIKSGAVRIDGVVVKKPRSKVQFNQTINISAEAEEKTDWSPENITLNIVYEDDDLFIINKPAGLVVHPGAGNLDGTLVNALLHYEPELSQVPRAGLIHRLDKETSGLLVVARNLSSHSYLVQALQSHKIERIYQAIVQGVIISGGTIDIPIGRHTQQRTKMTTKLLGGKKAITHYKIIQRFNHFTHLKVQLETGRTHQIRVHFAHIHHPLLGDPVYGNKQIPKGNNLILNNAIQHFKRQALHASALSLQHPKTKENMTWSAPLPEDIKDLLEILKREDLTA